MADNNDRMRYRPYYDEGEHAHRVDGKNIEDRDELELQLRDGHWARVVYLRKEHTRRGATLSLLLARDWDATMTFNESMVLRWPEKSEAA